MSGLPLYPIYNKEEWEIIDGFSCQLQRAAIPDMVLCQHKATKQYYWFKKERGKAKAMRKYLSVLIVESDKPLLNPFEGARTRSSSICTSDMAKDGLQFKALDVLKEGVIETLSSIAREWEEENE